jgi:IS4 transposase
MLSHFHLVPSMLEFASSSNTTKSSDTDDSMLTKYTSLVIDLPTSQSGNVLTLSLSGLLTSRIESEKWMHHRK